MTVKEFLDTRCNWLSGSVAIHCDTEEKAHRLLEVFHKLGKTWKTGEKYTTDDRYNNYKTDTCYLNNGTFGSKQACEHWRVQVIEFDDLDDFKKTEQLLDSTDFNYLSTLLKPFQSKNVTVTKRKSQCHYTYYLEICFNGMIAFSLPAFQIEADMYTNLTINTPYTLADLGIIKLTCKFKVGDLVNVIEPGYCYSEYEGWFEKTGNKNLLASFYLNMTPSKKRDYIVVASAPHTSYENEMVVAIKDVKGQVYLIGQDGLEAIK